MQEVVLRRAAAVPLVDLNKQRVLETCRKCAAAGII